MKQELIWELMKQAGELAYEEHKAKCLKEGLDPEHTVWSVTGAHYEKFAELIVKECIKVCEPVFLDEPYEDMSEFGKGLVEGQDVAVEKIKEHFGVEE